MREQDPTKTGKQLFSLQNICSEPAWKMFCSLYLAFANAVLDTLLKKPNPLYCFKVFIVSRLAERAMNYCFFKNIEIALFKLTGGKGKIRISSATTMF